MGRSDTESLRSGKVDSRSGKTVQRETNERDCETIFFGGGGGDGCSCGGALTAEEGVEEWEWEREEGGEAVFIGGRFMHFVGFWGMMVFWFFLQKINLNYNLIWFLSWLNIYDYIFWWRPTQKILLLGTCTTMELNCLFYTSTPNLLTNCFQFFATIFNYCFNHITLYYEILS